MLIQNIYVCEKCGQKLEDRKRMQNHEAKCFGLTKEEYKKWCELRFNVSQMNVDDYEIEALEKFEQEHNITKVSWPKCH